MFERWLRRLCPACLIESAEHLSAAGQFANPFILHVQAGYHLAACINPLTPFDPMKKILLAALAALILIGYALATYGFGLRAESTAKAWVAALPNAVPYLQAFGHGVVAWIWLDVALAVTASASPLQPGKVAAMRYFYAYELPKIGAWLGVVASREPLVREMREEWF